MVQAKGVRRRRRRVTQELRDLLRAEYRKGGMGVTELAAFYGLHRSTIARALHGPTESEKRRNANLQLYRFPGLIRTDVPCPKLDAHGYNGRCGGHNRVTWQIGRSVSDPAKCYRCGHQFKIKRKPQRAALKPRVPTYRLT